MKVYVVSSFWWEWSTVTGVYRTLERAQHDTDSEAVWKRNPLNVTEDVPMWENGIGGKADRRIEEFEVEGLQ